LGPRKELFKAWVGYGICPGEWAYKRAWKNKLTIDAYTYEWKKLYRALWIAKKDPMALHRAMKDKNIRGYVKEALMLRAEDVVFLPEEAKNSCSVIN
jgi:hypothetical protein